MRPSSKLKFFTDKLLWLEGSLIAGHQVDGVGFWWGRKRREQALIRRLLLENPGLSEKPRHELYDHTSGGESRRGLRLTISSIRCRSLATPPRVSEGCVHRGVDNPDHGSGAALANSRVNCERSRGGVSGAFLHLRILAHRIAGDFTVSGMRIGCPLRDADVSNRVIPPFPGARCRARCYFSACVVTGSFGTFFSSHCTPERIDPKTSPCQPWPPWYVTSSTFAPLFINTSLAFCGKRIWMKS